MTTKIQSIAKNTSYFTFALVLQKIISFSYFTILARNLIPGDLGKYYLALAVTSIFSIITDLGITNVLTREVAKQRDKAGEYLSAALLIKIPLSVVALLGIFLMTVLMDYPELTRMLVYISSAAMLLDSFTFMFYAIIRGFHNLIFESIASVVFQVIVFAVGLSALRLGWGLGWLMGALVAASLFNFIFSLLLVRFKWKLKLWPRINPKLIKSLIIITVPFGLFAILQRLYMYMDTVLLGALAGDIYVGYYQIAFKIIFALQFLPMAFIASLYPAFSSYWSSYAKASEDKRENHQIVVTFERAMNYLIIVSLPISVGVITLADKIIMLFKPEYIHAVRPLQIIIGSLLFLFLNFPIGALLNACDRQKQNTINMGITLMASILLNIFLIPRFQAEGAAITVLATNALMFVLGIRLVPEIIKYRPMKILEVFIKVFAAALFMGVAVVLLKMYLNVFVVSILGGIIYFALLFMLGGFKKEDIMSIVGAFLKKT